MKIFGMFFVVISAMIFAFERTSADDRRLRVLLELTKFIERLRIDIGCYLKPVSDIAAAFSSDTLSELGFLSDIREMGADKAYVRLEEKKILRDEEKRILSGFFSRLGEGYAEDELKLIDSALQELSALIKVEREKAPKRKKLFLTLSCAGALALIILLI